MTDSVAVTPAPVVVLRSVAELRAELRKRRQAADYELRVGLVPTMGALHEGHLSLIGRAREQCDLVVVSLFVNPAQFNEAADLEHYPRREGRDRQLAQQAGADILFAPPDAEIYPPGFATTVSISGVSEPLEGARRGRRHFEGVATIVAKLLNIVDPDVAYFGAKDAQQGAVVKRLVADLNFDVAIELCPTVREHDGLALSSRNVKLNVRERARAVALHHALELAAHLVDGGERDSAKITARARDELDAAGVQTEYFELVDPVSFRTVAQLGDRPVLAVVAARIGTTRLIDNQLLEPAHVNRH